MLRTRLAQRAHNIAYQAVRRDQKACNFGVLGPSAQLLDKRFDEGVQLQTSELGYEGAATRVGVTSTAEPLPQRVTSPLESSSFFCNQRWDGG